MMKKILLSFTTMLALSVAAALIFHPAPAHADFNANNLMDDDIFTAVNSMSAAGIDSWLNQFPNSCISTNNGFSAPDPTGYTPSNGFTYDGNVSAGQVIYDAAQGYGINPQVLLVTLQKEQSLVTGSAGCSILQYAGATGYGCPDGGTTYSYNGVDLYSINGNEVTSVSGTCVNSSARAGFSQQVIHAAWLLMFGEQRSKGNISWDVQKTNSPEQGDVYDDSDDPQTCYGGPMTQGTWVVCPGGSATFYDGSYTIDGTTVQITTGATAALYWYTPHFAGNQNFDSLFQSWFGSFYVPQYSWQLLGFSYSTNTNSFGAGVAGTATLTAKNTGTVPWYNYGANPVRLGTWLPGRVSPLYSPSWLSPTRPANMNQVEVDPGGTATFTIPIDITALGTYVEGLNLVVENSQWMPWPGLSPTINIQPAYQWQVSSVTYSAGTGLMIPGTTQQITVTAINSGFATWSNSSGPPIRLGTWLPGRVSGVAYNWLGSARAAGLTEASVAPGQTGTFQFMVRTPGSGIFYERMNLVAEGQTWFNDAGLTLYLQGGTYSWKPLWSTYSTGGNANLPRGTTMTVTIKALNTGNIPWTNTTSASFPWPIRLATDDPENRGSFLYDTSWINDTRPATLQESTVQPGQQGTFVFTADIPSSASTGQHFEYFNLVAEGILWFNDPGFYLYLNVL
ncbi:MAG TPA: hypothetical protein VEH48_00485 [Candidatus Nitrosopolaris sp.]|nr:hypothetical protein [Candidatus Nitrosopolaris sp.]